MSAALARGAARTRKEASPPAPTSSESAPVRQTQRRVDQAGSGDGLDLGTVGGRITWARLREELTQEEIAKTIGKVRPTVVQYEANKIVPPLDVIQKLSIRLKVSPSFLAFGEHGIQTMGNAGEDVVNIDQITFGRDGQYQSGVFALPRDLVVSYASDARDLKAYVMNHHAPHFDLRTGDRVFADTSVTELTNVHDTYLLDTNGGMEIVRVPPTLSKTDAIDVIGPNGEKINVKVKELSIIGAVVSTLKSK